MPSHPCSPVYCPAPVVHQTSAAFGHRDLCERVHTCVHTHIDTSIAVKVHPRFRGSYSGKHHLLWRASDGCPFIVPLEKQPTLVTWLPLYEIKYVLFVQTTCIKVMLVPGGSKDLHIFSRASGHGHSSMPLDIPRGVTIRVWIHPVTIYFPIMTSRQ